MKQSGVEIANVALKNAGHDVTLLEGTSIYIKDNRRMDVVCNICSSTVQRSFNDLKKGKFFCKGCYDIKVKNILNANNFTLKEEKKRTVVCDCLVCGTERELSIPLLYKGCAICCYQCQYNKYKTQAANYNFNFVKHDNDRLYLNCKICSTEKVLSGTSHLLGDANVNCDTCRLNGMRARMNPLGFTVLCHRPKLAILECNSCGYWKRSTPSQVANGGLACINCRTIKYENALSSRGCKLLFIDGKQIYYINSIGETRLHGTSEILSGKFSDVENSRWSSPTYVYMIVCKFEGEYFCKIGTAFNPEQRLKNLKLVGETSQHIIGKYKNRQAAVKVEHDFHKILEPFKIQPTNASRFSTHVIRGGEVDGVTEWFDSYAIHLLEGWLNHGVNRYSED